MAKRNQDTRFLAVDAPKLVLVSVSGREELSRLYEYQLELVSEDGTFDAEEVSPADIIGHELTVRLDTDKGDKPRYFHGVVRDFALTGWTDTGATYSATLVPDLWKLTQTTDCRIFQDKSTVDILKEVLPEFGVKFEEKGLGDYEKRVYCVQYRESYFNFVSRLMEEDGIYYYFKHEKGKHTLVLCDSPSGYYDLDTTDDNSQDKDVIYGERSPGCPVIYSWRRQFAFRPGKFAQTDYNFETPSSDLKAEETSEGFKGAEKLEVFQYPGRHLKNGHGKQLARVRIEAIESDRDLVVGDGTYRSFAPAGRFKIGRHPSRSEDGQRYALTSVDTFASIGNYTGSGGGAESYRNRFTAVPVATKFRAKRTAARPAVEGPQTAVVVGPSGEEIFTDEYGRVKVQFHWDRKGKKDEKSSCWVRVSQPHAGKNFGYMDIPRVGEEVIVSFLEGDPDAPIITGRVYNAERLPNYKLKGGNNAKNKTRRGFVTQTYKGEGYNEFTMDDTAGEEEIRLHAQYDMNSEVEHDQTLLIKNDRTAEVQNNEEMKVGVDQKEEIGNNRELKIGMNELFDVGMEEKITIGMQSAEEVGMAKKIQAGVSVEIVCGGSSIKMTPASIELKAPMIMIN